MATVLHVVQGWNACPPNRVTPTGLFRHSLRVFHPFLLRAFHLLQFTSSPHAPLNQFLVIIISINRVPSRGTIFSAETLNVTRFNSTGWGSAVPILAWRSSARKLEAVNTSVEMEKSSERKLELTVF